MKKKRAPRYFFLLLTVFISQFLFAESNFIEITEEGSIPTSNVAQAQQKLTKDLITKVSLKYIEEIIGSQKVEANRGQIKKRILDQSARYVPVVKVGDPQQEKDFVKLTVTIRISLDNLKELLLKEGFLKNQEVPGLVIPVVAFIDRVKNESFRWWFDHDSFLSGSRALASKWSEQARPVFQRNSFYLISPLDWKYSSYLPPSIKKELLSKSDDASLAEIFGAQIVVRGSVVIDPTSINGSGPEGVKCQTLLSANLTQNGRVIGEVRGEIEMASHPSQSVRDREKLNRALDDMVKDLVTQVSEAWQRGVVSTNFIRLAVVGRLSYQQREKFKNLLTRIKPIRRLNERSFENQRVVYEIDASISSQQLGAQINGIGGPEFLTKVTQITPEALEVQVRMNEVGSSQ